MSLPNLASLTFSTNTGSLKAERTSKRDRENDATEDKNLIRLEKSIERLEQEPRRGIRLDIDENPTRVLNEGSFNMQQLTGNAFINLLCDSQISRAYVEDTLDEDNLVWLIRDRHVEIDKEKFSGTIFGFAVASTRKRNIQAVDGRVEEVTVLHLEVICASRGEGMTLFGNILRYALKTKEYDYVELEALNDKLVELYQKTASKWVGGLDKGLVGIPPEDYEKKAREAFTQTFSNYTDGALLLEFFQEVQQKKKEKWEKEDPTNRGRSYRAFLEFLDEEENKKTSGMKYSSENVEDGDLVIPTPIPTDPGNWTVETRKLVIEALVTASVLKPLHVHLRPR